MKFSKHDAQTSSVFRLHILLRLKDLSSLLLKSEINNFIVLNVVLHYMRSKIVTYANQNSRVGNKEVRSVNELYYLIDRQRFAFISSRNVLINAYCV